MSHNERDCFASFSIVIWMCRVVEMHEAMALVNYLNGGDGMCHAHFAGTFDTSSLAS